jgi:hypothetical protein
VPPTGAADPADTPTNPIPTAINAAITILRIRFSFSVLSIRRAGGGSVRSAAKLTPNRRHRLVFASIETR